MAREPKKVNQEHREAERLAASIATMEEAETELTDEQTKALRDKLITDGNAHRYNSLQGATREKKAPPLKPRKEQSDLFKQTGLRMHPQMFKEIQDIAAAENKDWAEAARQLLTEALRARNFESHS